MEKRKIKKKIRSIKAGISLFFLCLIFWMSGHTACAFSGTNESGVNGTTVTAPGSAETGEDLKDLNVGNNLTISYNGKDGQLVSTLRILITLTLISLAPSLILVLTSFTRIIIVLHFTRTALNTQSAPPNQVLVGMALFLTCFIMAPVFSQINENAWKPFNAGEITQEKALEEGMKPLRTFMMGETQKKDIKLFMEIAKLDAVESEDDIPISVLIPSFILSELRTAFILGFIIYIPFIIIDMVVASTLMSMGMMMLPPTTISMPFKILLFVLADGWGLIIGNLVKTFHVY